MFFAKNRKINFQYLAVILNGLLVITQNTPRCPEVVIVGSNLWMFIAKDSQINLQCLAVILNGLLGVTQITHYISKIIYELCNITIFFFHRFPDNLISDSPINSLK